MPKNKGKGGKNRRRGKNENEGLKRELVFKEDGQEYAQVKYIYIKTTFFLTIVSSNRSPKCLEMVDWKQCALMELNAFVTFVENFVKKSGSISLTSF